ncbi:Uncharacterised protein [Mycobacteroides abscessus subsp. massiliense]|nr:Uncharacterised protein [Mycobacteroides abscessus subsp. massiliense]
MKAWIRPTNRSNDFQMALGAHMIHAGNIAIKATMMPPANMLPKSRSESEIGLASSSIGLMKAVTQVWPLSSLIGWPMRPRRAKPAMW